MIFRDESIYRLDRERIAHAWSRSKQVPVPHDVPTGRGTSTIDSRPHSDGYHRRRRLSPLALFVLVETTEKLQDSKFISPRKTNKTQRREN